MVLSVCSKQKNKGRYSTTMKILTQNDEHIQAISEKVLTEIPFALTADNGEIYILIKDLSKKMRDFIDGERIKGIDLHVFSIAYEERTVMKWRDCGYKCTYHSQSMQYLGRDVIIKYLHVRNPRNKAAINLIPWFMLPRKKYPVTAYAYAAWYITQPEEKAGVRKTGDVVKEIFGLDKFDPSTVSRACAQMTRVFAKRGEDAGPLSIQEPETDATVAEIVKWATEYLERRSTPEAEEHDNNEGAVRDDPQTITAILERAGEENDKECAGEVISNGNESKVNTARGWRAAGGSVNARILGNIPGELAKVTKPKPDVQSKVDRRDRPARPRGERLPAQRDELDFIETDELKMKRIKFTGCCKNIVLNAASLYHKFLI